MADISDVEKAIVDVLVGIIYPAGTEAASISGTDVRIFRGWPSPLGLNADLGAAVTNVSVFADPASTRETTRYPQVWRTGPTMPPTLGVELAAGVATFTGAGGAGQNAGVLVGGAGYAVPVGPSDTPATIAAALAAMIPGAAANGTSLSVAGQPIAAARVEGSATAWQETRRQEQALSVGLWCPDPAVRDTLAAAIDAALSEVDWLALPDSTSGRLIYKQTTVADTSENANLYRRDLVYTVEYPTIVRRTVPAMIFGTATMTVDTGAALAPSTVFPLLGAIRFDAWYDPTDTIDQQCAVALSPSAWHARLPPNAVIDRTGTASWPLATQDVIDAEIEAAAAAGLDFWAFDAYRPDDGLSRALSLYLSSTLRPRLGFCMLGQSSAWADAGTADGYSATFSRDIAMMSEQGYVRVADGRPLYLVLDAPAAALAALPSGGIAQAIATVRARTVAAGAGNPYIVWLSGAALADYDNTPAAIAAGADAAGAYATPRYQGTTLPYAALAANAEADWTQRAGRGFPFVPTAMTGWDQRPLIETPQPFYPIPAGLTDSEYFTSGTAQDIADHVGAMATGILAHAAACPANVGLVYAWNELAEGGWLMPTFGGSGPDATRTTVLGSTLARVRKAALQSQSFTS